MNKAQLEAELQAAQRRIAELEQGKNNPAAVREAFERGRLQAETEILQLNRLYATLSQINTTIVHVRSREELFARICQVAVEYGEFQLAWIGVTETSNDRFHPVCSSTFNLKDLPFSKPKFTPAKLEDSLVGKALATSKSITSDDIQADPLTAHWREVAMRRGYHSQAAVPFKLKGQPIGVLSLYSSTAGFFNSEKEIRLLDEIGTDISFALETIEAEEALRESEKKYSLLFDKAGIPASLTKLPENTFADINKAFEKIFGYTKEEVLGRTSLQLGMIRPEDQSRIVEAVRTSGQANDTERRICTKSGEERIVTIDVNTIQLDGSQYAITTLHDITSRKRMENQLRNQADLLELAHDSITVLDMNGKITYWNRGAADRYGWSSEEARGQVIHELLKTIFPIPLETIEAQLLDGGFWEGELTHTRRNGDQIIVASRWQLQRENGQPAAILEINNDITSRKQAERALARKNTELASLYTQTEHRLENISALRTIDVAIASSFDMDFTLSILLEQTLKRTGVEAADVLVFNPVTRLFRRAAQSGFQTPARAHAALPFSNGYPSKVVRERKTITIQNISREVHEKGETPETSELLRRGFTAYKGVPLIAKGLVRGVMEVYQRKPFAMDAEQRSFLDALAGQAAIAIDSAQLFESLQDSNTELRLAYDETIEGWSQAMDLRDRETEGHSLRVTDQTVRLASRLGVTEEELVHIRRGALLHDMGKLGIPDDVLLKPGPLTDKEWESMRLHPQLAYDMLSRINYLQPALDIPYCHHERWDGSGYPRGLRDDQIPLSARAFAVIDVWDALTSDRPYREAWPKQKALTYMQEQAGKLFDPRVVSTFMREIP
jgi:PAS domain S-box-containing protein